MTSETDVPPDFSAVPALYDRVAEEYDESYVSPAFQREDVITASLIKRASRGAGNTIDLGCGTGKALELMVPRSGYKGVDVSPLMLAKARAKFPDRDFVEGSVTNLPFADQTFDFAISTYGSLSHVADMSKAIFEAGRVLKPGSRALFMLYGLDRKSKPSRKTSEIVNYRLRGVQLESTVAAHLLSVSDAKQLVAHDFRVNRVRGLTVLHVRPMKSKGSAIVRAFYALLDIVICYLRPDMAHTLVIIGVKRKEKRI